MRARAIRDALWYGLRPSWMYEPTPHYDCGYLRHAAMNLALAWRWAILRETDEDRAFAAPSVTFETTERGFRHYTPIATSYGHDVKVYESSSAVPSLWLALDASLARTANDANEICAHLTLAQVNELRDTLTAAVADHWSDR